MRYTRKADMLKYRLKAIILFMLNGFKPIKTILFYPKRPHGAYVIRKICWLAGYNIIDDPKQDFDIAFNWEDTTFRATYPCLKELAKKITVLNINCKNISKENVDFVFRKVFGYGLTINPLTHSGECVKKNNLNAKRDGKIVSCPIKEREDGFVYQMIVNNRFNDFLVEDIRVPIFKGRIPIIYSKYRLISDRFGRSTYRSKISELSQLLSHEEIKKILLFCERIGLDYGELDIVRNRDDGKIYITDVNNTPYGPPSRISEKE